MAKARPYWLCRGCGYRNERRKQKCAGEGCNRSRPKRRVPKHETTLRDDSYAVYLEFSARVHGVVDEECAICAKPRHQDMHHHRDHGHLKGDPAYGKPRGIVCFSCNRLMPRELDAARAQLIADYLARVEAHYRELAA